MPDTQKSSGRTLSDKALQDQEKKTQLEVPLPAAPNLDQEKLDDESKANPQAPRNGENVATEI